MASALLALLGESRLCQLSGGAADVAPAGPVVRGTGLIAARRIVQIQLPMIILAGTAARYSNVSALTQLWRSEHAA